MFLAIQTTDLLHTITMKPSQKQSTFSTFFAHSRILQAKHSEIVFHSKKVLTQAIIP